VDTLPPKIQKVSFNNISK